MTGLTKSLMYEGAGGGVFATNFIIYLTFGPTKLNFALLFRVQRTINQQKNKYLKISPNKHLKY